MPTENEDMSCFYIVGTIESFHFDVGSRKRSEASDKYLHKHVRYSQFMSSTT